MQFDWLSHQGLLAVKPCLNRSHLYIHQSIVNKIYRYFCGRFDKTIIFLRLMASLLVNLVYLDARFSVKLWPFALS